MNREKQKFITFIGLWLAAIIGSTFGLVFTIAGYLLDWGPGSGMIGPMWRILLVGIPSILIAAYAGKYVVSKLSLKIFSVQSTDFKNSFMAAIIVFTGGIIAFIIGWEIGFLMGKIIGAIEGIDWIAVLLYTPLMSFIWGIPVCLIAAILFGIFVFIYLKKTP